MEHDAALGGQVRGEKRVGTAEADRKEQAPPEAGHRHAAFAGVRGEDVVVAARIIELLGPRPHEHVIGRQLAEVDRRLRHVEIHRGRRREIADEEHREPFGRDFVDRPEGQAVSVGERQVLVDPGAARQALRVQLAGRQHDLPVLAVDRVAVVVDGDKVVVGSDLLQLAERVEQRTVVPKRHVLDRRGVAFEVRARQMRFARQRLLGDLFERERGPRRGDVVRDERGLAHLLVGPHHEALDHRGVRRTGERHDEIEAPGEQQPDEPVAAEGGPHREAGAEH